MSSEREKLLSVFIEQQDALLRFLARRLGDATLAEDLTQETWLRAANVGGASVIGNPKSYLFRVASNLAFDHMRRAHRAGDVGPAHDVSAAIPDPAPNSESIVLTREELRVLGAAIDALPQRCRQVFLLARVEGLSYVEIGARLGISPKTAFSHMVRALGILQVRMDRIRAE
ncbi:MAG: RNA polymerase sigma factor [Alphaproteobacteria bacterium]